MNRRYSIVILAVGTTLALGAPVAQAQFDQSVRSAPVTMSTSAYTAAQQKAQELRWAAIGNFYLKHYGTHTSQALRPNDRAGALGA